MKHIALLITWVCLFNCSGKKHDTTNVVIVGKGFNDKIQKVYLTEARKWKVLLDSAQCIDGKFIFQYHPQLQFEPLLVTVYYQDNKGKLKPLPLRNEVEEKADGKIHRDTGFFLDFGTTQLTPCKCDSKTDLVTVIGGKEEDLFKQYEHQNFGYLPMTKNLVRQNRLDMTIDVIKKNTSSFYLLSKITQFRERYSKLELQEILECFDRNIQTSTSALRLRNYIENSLDQEENTRQLTLLSDKGTLKTNINRYTKLNMLIFWASWCSPCRLELPQLKTLHKLVQSEDFYMASISIDKDKKAWREALQQESLSWDQFIIQDDLKEKLSAEYRTSTIPLVIFTDGDGREISRFVGFSPDHYESYKKLISDKIHFNIN